MPAARRKNETEEEFLERKRQYKRNSGKKERQRDQDYWKEYRRNYQKEYRKTPEGQESRARHRRSYNRKSKVSVREFIDSFKTPCQCGESMPCALDFHHRDPKEKEFNISQAITRRKSVDKLLKEIEKCDVICANCHRKLHYFESLAAAPPL